MKLRLNTLRWRLVLAFILVSVPPMLGAAFAVGTLVSRTFETNVRDWLTETAHYFESQIDESQADADHIAQLMAKRLKGADLTPEALAELLHKDAETLELLGFTHIAVYRPQGELVYTNNAALAAGTLPQRAGKTILALSRAKEDYLLNCAVAAVETAQGPAFVLVGAVLDQNALIEGKAINALKIQLFQRRNDSFNTDTAASDTPIQPPQIEVVRRLDAGEDSVIFNDPNDGIYLSLFVAIRDSERHMVGAAFIGLGSDAGFVTQITQFGIFPGIFLIGMVLSVGAGLFLSGIIALPLKALSAGVRSVTAGDYSQRVALGGGAEISELASGFNGMAEQLTRLRALEDQLRRRDRLSTLGEASAVIAHEVRNPLGIIKTSAEVVRNRAELRPAEARLMGYIIDETRRIEKLIREVLDFARPRQIERTPLQVRGILDGVLAIAQTELVSRKVRLKVRDDAKGAQIAGDADRLHQAFLNLTLNAIDAMPEGGEFEIALSFVPEGLQMIFSDTGSGIAPEIAARIFDPFFTTKVKGTGLGLAQVASLAEALGGKVALLPKTTQGAAIVLTLPILSPAPKA